MLIRIAVSGPDKRERRVRKLPPDRQIVRSNNKPAERDYLGLSEHPGNLGKGAPEAAGSRTRLDVHSLKILSAISHSYAYTGAVAISH
jgi:hypothetical protein